MAVQVSAAPVGSPGGWRGELFSDEDAFSVQVQKSGRTPRTVRSLNFLHSSSASHQSTDFPLGSPNSLTSNNSSGYLDANELSSVRPLSALSENDALSKSLPISELKEAIARGRPASSLGIQSSSEKKSKASTRGSDHRSKSASPPLRHKVLVDIGDEDAMAAARVKSSWSPFSNRRKKSPRQEKTLAPKKLMVEHGISIEVQRVCCQMSTCNGKCNQTAENTQHEQKADLIDFS